RGGGFMPSVPRRQTFSVGYFILAALALFWLQTLLSPQARQIPYSEFRDMLAKGWVERVVLSDTLIRGTVKPEHAGDQKSFVTVRVADDQLGPEPPKQDVRNGA